MRPILILIPIFVYRLFQYNPNVEVTCLKYCCIIYQNETRCPKFKPKFYKSGSINFYLLQLEYFTELANMWSALARLLLG